MVSHQTQFTQARMMEAFYACATAHITKDPREFPEHKETWTFWCRIWFMCREYIDDGRYPHNIRADSCGPFGSQADAGIPITEVSFEDLMVAYYG